MRTNGITIILLLGFHVGSSQELRVSFSRLWTNNVEMQTPVAVGIHASKSLSGFFTAEIGYQYLFDERAYGGILPTGMLPQQIVWESIESVSHASLWKLGLLFYPLQFEFVSVGVGAYASTNFFSSTKTGSLTTRQVGPLRSQKMGIGYAVDIRFVPSKSVPLFVNVRASQDFLSSSTITTEMDVPFGNSMNVKALQFGFGYVFQ